MKRITLILEVVILYPITDIEVYRSRSRSIGQFGLGRGQLVSVEVEGGVPLLGGKEKKMKNLLLARIEPTRTKSMSLPA